MWKYFVPNMDKEDDIKYLRTILPNHYYANAIVQGTNGVIARPKIKNDEHDHIKYSEWHDSTLGEDIKFAILEDKEIDIKKFQKESSMAINVDLINGQRMQIIPAIAQPKKVIFGHSHIKERIPEAANYNQSTRYGKLGYDLLYRIEDQDGFAVTKDDDDLVINDPHVLEFVQEAILYSYHTLTTDIFNYLGIITIKDVEQLMIAGLGRDPRLIKKDEQSIFTVENTA